MTRSISSHACASEIICSPLAGGMSNGTATAAAIFAAARRSVGRVFSFALLPSFSALAGG
jgi:hypothetical protein